MVNWKNWSSKERSPRLLSLLLPYSRGSWDINNPDVYTLEKSVETGNDYR